jgi:hypothetical protein
MIQVDVDKSGNVDYTEFLATMMNKHKASFGSSVFVSFKGGFERCFG